MLAIAASTLGDLTSFGKFGRHAETISEGIAVYFVMLQVLHLIELGCHNVATRRLQGFEPLPRCTVFPSLPQVQPLIPH